MNKNIFFLLFCLVLITGCRKEKCTIPNDLPRENKMVGEWYCRVISGKYQGVWTETILNEGYATFKNDGTGYRTILNSTETYDFVWLYNRDSTRVYLFHENLPYTQGWSDLMFDVEYDMPNYQRWEFFECGSVTAENCFSERWEMTKQ